MSVKPGKFSKLPHLALREIARQMDLSELITLCFMCPQMQIAAKFLKYSIKMLKWLIDTRGLFAIHIIDQNRHKLVFRLAPGLLSKFVKCQVLIDDQNVDIWKNADTFSLNCETSERVELFEALTKFLLRICKPEKFNFCSNLYLESIFKHTRKFETFNLTHQTLSLENAKLIFEGIEANVFNLDNVELETGEVQKFELKHRYMRLGTAHWLSRESLENMKCETLRFNQRKMKTQNIQSSDFVSFTKSWFSGGLENLKTLEIALPNIKGAELEVEEIGNLDGVEINRNKYFFTRADGKRAQMSLNAKLWEFSIL